MNKIVSLLLLLVSFSGTYAQNDADPKPEDLLKELSQNACKCIDSISVYNKGNDSVSKEINKCITEATRSYQLGVQLINALKKADPSKGDTIYISDNENSKDFNKYYDQMESYLMDSCPSIKTKIASAEKQSDKSMSLDAKAREYYNKGMDASKKEDYKKAIEYYSKAVKIDPEFAFAWDNLGLSYRKIDDYDNALMAYDKSLSIDSTGLLPLQNIAVVYQYKKEYQKAIEAYQRMLRIDKDNPEIYFGIGQITAVTLNDPEKGLGYLCKAYNLYTKMKSPYRSDAEKLIQYVYDSMKKDGKTKKFEEILKENNISTE